MDPISIATTSATLVSTCTKLWGYINKIQNVDTAVQVLQLEITSLSQVLGAIGSSFNDPTLAKAALETQTGHEAQHWQHVKRSMEDCKGTLASLERILEGVTGVSGGLFRRPKTLIKLDMKAVEIALFQQRLTAYRQTMQLSLQMITVTSGLSQHTNISFMLEDLTVKVNSLQQSIDDNKHTRLAASTNANESRIMTNLEDCVRSARRMVSSAASIVSARSVRDSQMGSEHGEQLTEQQRTRIQEWIPPPTIPEDEEHENLHMNPDDTQNEMSNNLLSTTSSNVGSPSGPGPSSDLFSERQPETSVTSLSERMADLSTIDPHYDLQVGLIQIWRKSASTNFETKNYAEAEKYLKRIIDRSESLFGTRFDWRSEVVEMLAIAYCHLDKCGEAEMLLGEPFEKKQEVIRLLAAKYYRIGDWESGDRIAKSQLSGRDTDLKELLIEFCQQGRWIGVKKILEKKFEGRDQTAEALGIAFCHKGEPASAEKLLEENFDGKERVLRTLSFYYFQNRELTKAEKILMDLFTNIDESSVTYFGAMHTLAEVKLGLQKFNEAEEWALKAMRGQKSVFGMQHTLFYQSVNLLAAVYEAKDELVEAEGYRGLLPSEFEDCTELERLWRMGREEAANAVTASFDQWVDWPKDEVRKNIRKSMNGVAGHWRGFALIHLFATIGDRGTPLVELLIDKGVDVNARTYQGSTPLIVAAECNYPRLDITRQLLDAGADMEITDTNGMTALSTAVKNGNKTLINLFIAKGAQWEVDKPIYGRTPLDFAVAEDNIEGTRILLKRGANVDAMNPGYLARAGFSDKAPRGRKRDSAEEVYLVEDKTALHTAIRKGRLEHLRLLLDTAAQIDSMLFFALSVNSPESLGGSAPNIKVQIIELLLEKGALVNQYSDDLYLTPLHFAIGHEVDEVVEVLLKAGANIKLKDGNGNTALYYAKMYGRFKICDLLKQASPRWYKRR